MAQYRHIEKEGKKDRRKFSMDYFLVVIVLILSIFGIIMVFDSSIKLLSNKYHFVILQSLWVFLGLIGMIIFSYIPYKRLLKWILPMTIFTIICLILVLFVGKSTNGAFRWINLGPFEFQPSELMKPVIVIYLSSWFSKEKPKFTNIKELVHYRIFSEMIPFLILLLFVVGLIVIGKDLGTAIIVSSIALGLYFIQGRDAISVLTFVGSLGVIALTGLIAILTEPYRIKRILSFSGNSNDTLSGGYQISQILIAIGSGGWFGKGFTQSIQKQRYLVETTAATDSIFAVIAEEFGFLGSIILILGYVFFAYRCIKIAMQTEDEFGKFLVMGITIWIIAQAILNIAVNVNLVPLTGVPLPFISYGGSATIIMLSSIGIILNISKYSHERKE